jgi:thiol-disulfide isomerase/thioredoxin
MDDLEEKQFEEYLKQFRFRAATSLKERVAMKPAGVGSKGRFRLAIAASVLVVLGAVAAAYFFSTRIAPQDASKGGDGRVELAGAPPIPAIRGKEVPSFELPDLNGRLVRMADLRGKVLLVNFWATWCVPCRTEMPWFTEFQERYGPQGFEVIAISLDADPSMCEPFIETNGLENLTVLLGDRDIADEFGGVVGLPTTFMVDREGKLLFQTSWAGQQGYCRRRDSDASVSRGMMSHVCRVYLRNAYREPKAAAQLSPARL